jgi:hypothetical protein
MFEALIELTLIEVLTENHEFPCLLFSNNIRFG